MRKLIVRGLCLSFAVYMIIGCDQKGETTEKTAPAGSRGRTTASTATTKQPYRQRSHDDSLYLQTLESLHRDNRELKQQIADAVTMLLEMEEEINRIRAERDGAINKANEIQGSIATLQSNALSKDQRIRELEQANRQMQSTITSLTQQVNQLLSELNAQGASGTAGTAATTGQDSGDMQ